MDVFANEPSLTGQADSAPAEQAQPSVTSLDSLSEFEFQGEKLTPDRLQEVMQGYKTLSEKQRSYANEERFIANLDTDIESVLADPSLVEKFKSIYPEKYHRVLDRVLARISPRQEQQSQTLPKEVMAALQDAQSAKRMVQQMAVESANAKLDALLPKLYEKYPLANEDQVLARAEAMLSQGMKLSDASWERIAKESHEFVKKKSDAFYKKELQAQVNIGQAGKDAGPGGAVPGKAPQKIRTFDEASKAAIEHLKSQGWT